MASIALFHSVLGVRTGVLDAAARLRAAGHDVQVVDQYDGRVFDDYKKASAFAESIGYRRVARGNRNRDNYRLRVLLIGGGLSSPHLK